MPNFTELKNMSLKKEYVVGISFYNDSVNSIFAEERVSYIVCNVSESQVILNKMLEKYSYCDRVYINHHLMNLYQCFL